jgi:hypothetical protein
MAFLIPEYSDEIFVRVTKPNGESYLCPQGYQELENGDEEETIVGKWFCHLTAPGYMDQTDWNGPFDTEEEARENLRDSFDVDPDTGDDLDY